MSKQGTAEWIAERAAVLNLIDRLTRKVYNVQKDGRLGLRPLATGQKDGKVESKKSG